MRFLSWDLTEPNKETAAALETAGVSPLVAAVLAARGFRTPEEAEDFLSRELSRLEDPFMLRDMDLAVSRIKTAMEAGEKIAVYGDYDVDGITATCMLSAYLRAAGADCSYYIPDRIEEGYGLNDDAITHLHQQGVTLVITVDCGITALDSVEHARSLDIDVVITDHHACQEVLPDAVAVVNPHRKDSPAAFQDLAGVGVALKLLFALAGEENREAILDRYADLAALGTVADVVSVTGENRVIVSRGLAALDKNPRLGLRALLQEANLEGRPITAISIGFMLAPRINAAGRMGKAWVAAELLLTEDAARAEALAAELCAMNRERQAIEQKIFKESIDRMEGLEKSRRPSCWRTTAGTRA
jgi:single-stranded-DNA-specific exonuclease